MYSNLNSNHFTAIIKGLLPTLSLLFLLSACFSPDPATPLKSTYWSLIELEGEASDNVAHQPQVHLVFHINDKSLHGSDGCNRIQAGYHQEGDSFKFETIISTRMYCAEGMDQARIFTTALSKTDRMEIQEDQLILYSADVEIARFEAKEDF